MKKRRKTKLNLWGTGAKGYLTFWKLASTMNVDCELTSTEGTIGTSFKTSELLVIFSDSHYLTRKSTLNNLNPWMLFQQQRQRNNIFNAHWAWVSEIICTTWWPDRIWPHANTSPGSRKLPGCATGPVKPHKAAWANPAYIKRLGVALLI